MDGVSLLRLQLQIAHEVLEGTMMDVTSEQAQWTPPGVATPLGASYAHTVLSEDMVINGMLRHQPTLSMTTYAGKLGVSAPQPIPGSGWTEAYPAWTRSVQVDLPALKEYAQAVHRSSDEYLASLTPEDLDSTLDLSAIGMGQPTLAWAFSILVIGHINNIAGEISCLKGLQGAKGYPF